mmetsp:Transcript_42408/g.98139  ORF Transcript_42408/g.98139 Transcript_42408/m.98139 type:complete len:456 (+) Transcript_42408:3-1370(+)
MDATAWDRGELQRRVEGEIELAAGASQAADGGAADAVLNLAGHTLAEVLGPAAEYFDERSGLGHDVGSPPAACEMPPPPGVIDLREASDSSALDEKELSAKAIALLDEASHPEYDPGARLDATEDFTFDHARMSIKAWLSMVEQYQPVAEVLRLKKTVLIALQLGFSRDCYATPPVSGDFIPPRWWRCNDQLRREREVSRAHKAVVQELQECFRKDIAARRERHYALDTARAEAEGVMSVASLVQAPGFAKSRTGRMLYGMSPAQVYKFKHAFENQQSTEDAASTMVRAPCGLGSLRWFTTLLVFDKVVPTMVAIVFNRIYTELIMRENLAIVKLALVRRCTLYAYVDGSEGECLSQRLIEVCDGALGSEAIHHGIARVVQRVIMEGRHGEVAVSELLQGARGMAHGEASVVHAVGLRFVVAIPGGATALTVQAQEAQFSVLAGAIDEAHPCPFA